MRGYDMAKGMLVDYEWCSGCHSCEVACSTELSHAGFPQGHCGVKVHEEGLYQIGEERWTDIFMPIFTDLCDTCAVRRAGGEELPTCVKHCQAHVLKFGELDDLARDLAAKPKQVLYAL